MNNHEFLEVMDSGHLFAMTIETFTSLLRCWICIRAKRNDWLDIGVLPVTSELCL